MISIDAEKVFDNPTPICDENSQNTKNRGELLSLIKNTYKKLIPIITLKGEKLEIFSLRSERLGWSSHLSFSTLSWKYLLMQ